MYFAPPLKGSPWNWVPALGVKKLEQGYRDQKEVLKKFDVIFSRVNTIYERETDRQTDMQTDGHRTKTALMHSVAR